MQFNCHPQSSSSSILYRRRTLNTLVSIGRHGTFMGHFLKCLSSLPLLLVQLRTTSQWLKHKRCIVFNYCGWQPLFSRRQMSLAPFFPSLLAPCWIERRIKTKGLIYIRSIEQAVLMALYYWFTSTSTKCRVPHFFLVQPAFNATPFIFIQRTIVRYS